MQGNVISFQIDHRKLKPGVYLHDLKKIKNGYITTFDIRFKKPNKGDYLTPTISHTIEHILATFFTDYFKDKIYFGPMGCLTGFYLVLAGKHDVDELIKSLKDADDYFKKLYKNNEVPAKSPYRCGNYKLLDVKQAYKAWHLFYSKRNNWGKEYPLLPENLKDDKSFSNEIDYEVKLKI